MTAVANLVRARSHWTRLTLAVLLLGCGATPAEPSADYLRPFIGRWTGTVGGATLSLVIVRDQYQGECGIFGCPPPTQILVGTGSYTPRDAEGTAVVLSVSVSPGDSIDLFITPVDTTADAYLNFTFHGKLHPDRTQVQGLLWLRRALGPHYNSLESVSFVLHRSVP